MGGRETRRLGAWPDDRLSLVQSFKPRHRRSRLDKSFIVTYIVTVVLVSIVEPNSRYVHVNRYFIILVESHFNLFFYCLLKSDITWNPCDKWRWKPTRVTTSAQRRIWRGMPTAPASWVPFPPFTYLGTTICSLIQVLLNLLTNVL